MLLNAWVFMLAPTVLLSLAHPMCVSVRDHSTIVSDWHFSSLCMFAFFFYIPFFFETASIVLSLNSVPLLENVMALPHAYLMGFRLAC